ncbi:MAG: hypothetical protein AAB439_03735 [Patescibacteria group bacterium]
MTTPLFELHDIGTVNTKSGVPLRVMQGLSETHLQQLKKYSLDTSDTELAVTSDRKRFGTGSFEEWYAQGRTLYVAVTPDDVLAGIVWCGPKALPTTDREFGEGSEWHTVAYRSYGIFRGAGFMKKFCEMALAHYVTQNTGVRLYVQIACGNDASISLARSLGFVSLPTDALIDRTVEVLVK